ncbi:MAG: hypothetical protein ACLPND_19060 [Candidatus Korobacteraceae bacterium]
MRYFLCALLLCCSLAAQLQSPTPQASPAGNGSFYVNGIVYRYSAGTDYTVVTAAHSVLNHKFVAVKVRVYNLGQQSVAVKPEDVRVEDTLASQALVQISGTELARRMRRPYNWARLGVTPAGGQSDDTSPMSDQVGSQMFEMMRAMAARANTSPAPILSGSRSVLYTDTPGALPSRAGITPRDCDTVCRLRNREAVSPDVLAQLQRQTSPDYVEQSTFLANTITPQTDADGVLYFPMPKLAHGELAKSGKKTGAVQVTVPVGDEKFQFILTVE